MRAVHLRLSRPLSSLSPLQRKTDLPPFAVFSSGFTTSSPSPPPHPPSEDNDVMKVTRLGAVLNAALAVSKGLTGVVVGSTGMIADGVNSCGDLLMDAAVFVTILYARQGHTPDKPWGSGKFESIGALGVGVILITSGVGIGYSSLASAVDVGLLMHPGPEPGISSAGNAMEVEGRTANENTAALAVLLASMVSKEMLFRKTLRCGQATNSSVVIANAWHHRSDVFVSAAVCSGIIGGMLHYPLLDPLMGVLVSGILVHQGISTVIDSLKDLRDRPASQEETESLRRTCLSVDGIKSVEHLQARISGPFLFVDCTVGVPGTITASAAHRLSELAKDALLREHAGRVADVIVHADPIGKRGLGEKLPSWARHHGKIKRLVMETIQEECCPEIHSVEEVQVYYLDDGSVGVHLEVVMEPTLTITQANSFARHAKLVLQEKFPGMTYVDIDLELDFHPSNHQKFRESF